MVKIDQNRVAITIGDVCGKSVPASLFMTITQTVMRLVVRAGEDLQAEVGAANDLIVANKSLRCSAASSTRRPASAATAATIRRSSCVANSARSSRYAPAARRSA